MKQELVNAINQSNIKMGDKSEIIEYITKLERQITGLQTQVNDLKEKEDKWYGRC